MFVKIKMEPKSSKALATLKDITYIPVDDDATIITLKMLIEQYVNVPAEKQEIRTLTKSFANSQKVKELCDDRGSSIMLYAFDDDDFYDNQDSKFVCFLQIYTNESRFQFQEIELQSSGMTRAHEASLHHSSSSGTLIALSETESSDLESGSESDSNLECGSSEASDNSLSLTEQKKRKINSKQNVAQKRRKTTPDLDNISPTLCKYLDEFPKSQRNYRKCYETNSEGSSRNDSDNSKSPNITEKSHNPNTKNDTPIGTDGLINTPVTKEETPICSKEICISTPETHTTQSSPTTSTNANTAPTELPTKKPTLENCKPGVKFSISSTTEDYNHPYYTINPENRQYVQCIYSNSSDINKTDFEKLLEWFFDRFGTCDISHQLQFMHHSAITHFDGNVWIACMNKETCDWVSMSLPQYSLHPYKVESLTAASHLCEVVIPRVVTKANDLLDIFKLLEKQNPNLCTLQWCVLRRRTLVADEQDYNTKAVSAFCTNELLSIWLDSKSKVFLDGVNQKLKYCFWQIVFKFVDN